MKRTIITLLAILSLSVMVPAAYAQEYISEVSTLSELQQAIAKAKWTATKLRRTASMIYTVRPMRAPCLR